VRKYKLRKEKRKRRKAKKKGKKKGVFHSRFSFYAKAKDEGE